MGEGGTCTVRTFTAELDEAFVATHPGARVGRHSVLAIADTGVGMDDATRARIFEPFFTTKPQGTGLGLATVYGTVKQMGGYIWVDSKLGEGSTFTVYLPPCAPVAESEAPAPPEPAARPRENVLVVDNVAAVRKMFCDLLERLGYRPIPAEDVREALRIVGEQVHSIAAVITAAVIPGMSARELEAALRATDAQIGVLFVCSSDDQAAILFAEVDPDALLRPPFAPEELEARLRAVCRRSAAEVP